MDEVVRQAQRGIRGTTTNASKPDGQLIDVQRRRAGQFVDRAEVILRRTEHGGDDGGHIGGGNRGCTVAAERQRHVDSFDGTYVNRELVDSAVLANGDQIQMGKFRQVFLTAPTTA
jgi:pSer/pThr/pTyr-binding forkhead associated (FHA) protein